MLALVSGDNRADEKRASRRRSASRSNAPTPPTSREVTGYAIGGIPPVGHPREIITVFDEDLHRFETVWAAAGHPHAVFPIAPAALASAAKARVMRLAEA